MAKSYILMGGRMLASGNEKRSWKLTRVAKLLGIEYPIVQAPFGSFPSQQLTAAVSNLGGLGSLGTVTLGSSAISEVIAEIRGLTSKPFAINLGRTAQRQRAHRDVAAAGVGRGGSVAEERWGPAATEWHTFQLWRWPDAHELQPG
jgi:NAD(P)H-dependent flavin oxidoreductase YrpB (nitropropane dioxygenase family)